jgi:hypothetical protein
LSHEVVKCLSYGIAGAIPVQLVTIRLLIGQLVFVGSAVFTVTQGHRTGISLRGLFVDVKELQGFSGI